MTTGTVAQLTVASALALCYSVGFRSGHLVEAVAIMSAESARITNAEHLNNNGSIDRGLFQINSVHGEASTFDPVKNAGYAFRLSQGGKNWTAWAAYNNGAYQKYMPELRRFKLYHPWRWLRLVDGWRNNS